MINNDFDITDLDFDELNRKYFFSLYDKYRNNIISEDILLFDPGKEKETYNGKNTAYLLPYLPSELIEEVPYTNYTDLFKNRDLYEKEAKNVSLWLKKLHAGMGTSLERTKYLSSLKGLDLQDVRLGSKGTDLFVDLHDKRVSLAELQILNAIFISTSGRFKEIIFQEMLSKETLDAVKDIWSSSCFLDPGVSYSEYLSEMPNIKVIGPGFQAQQPNIDEEGNLTKERLTPGGHGLFAVDALLAASDINIRPDSSGKLILAIGNGEDLAGNPDNLITGWMIKEKIPIVMITTEKTELDTKGGQIALVKRPDGSSYISIIERGQAVSSNQTDLFEQTGLNEEMRTSFFNTNVVLINYDVLVSLLDKIPSHKTGLIDIVSPDLIKNTKSVKKDGIVKKYIQLEGAMGSSFLNLDKYWRDNFNQPLVHFLNVEKHYRTRFFTPVKNAFDFFLLYLSDRFVLEEEDMTLYDQGTGNIPDIHLDTYYSDLSNVLDSFEGVSLINLRKLKIRGPFLLRNTVLKGTVELVNLSGKLIDLKDYFSSEFPVFFNINVTFSSENNFNITEIIQ